MAKRQPFDVPREVLLAAEALKPAFDDRLMRHLQEQAEAIDRLRTSLAGAATSFPTIDASALEAARAVTDQFSALASTRLPDLDTYSGITASFAKLMEQASSPGIAEHFEKMQAASAPFTETHEAMRRALEFSQLADASLARITMEQIGAMLAVDEAHSRSLAAAAYDLSHSCEHLFDGLRNQEALFVAPQFVIERPPLEVYAHSRFLGAITIAPEETTEEELEDEPIDGLAALATETEGTLLDRLGALDSALVPMWKGALEALASQNPDRVRQASVSIREIFTHTLQTLAPDDAVRAWASSPKYLGPKNRPTRRGRLFFIARHVNRDPFSAFLEKDVDAALEAIDLLHKAVHTPDSGLTDKQARLLTLRVGNLFALMLEAASYNDS